LWFCKKLGAARGWPPELCGRKKKGDGKGKRSPKALISANSRRLSGGGMTGGWDSICSKSA